MRAGFASPPPALVVGSVCSGIGAPEVAWKRLGWDFAFAAEIDGFARAVYAHNHPGVPLHGDFTTIRAGQYRAIDALVGGTPCQSFSIAGLRGGLDGERGVLALEYLRLADRLRPRWIVWENVAGVLSSGRGRDLGAFLGALAELGYGFAYRVLDARFFGVPQRRRRVFVVGHSGADWRRAAAVLFERESLRGDAAPSGGAREGAADDPRGRLAFGGNNTSGPIAVTPSLLAQPGSGWKGDFDSETFIVEAVAVAFRGRDGGAMPEADEFVSALRASSGGSSRAFVAFAENSRDELRLAGGDGQTVPSLNSFIGGKAGRGFQAVTNGAAVRRLTPRECERLQGFPDDYTLVNWRGRPAPDGSRYRALGNSMAVPVVEWIGRRITAVDALELAA